MLVETLDDFRLEVSVIPESPEYEAAAIKMTNILRRAGIRTDYAFNGNAKKRFKIANDRASQAKLTIRGDNGEPLFIRLTSTVSDEPSDKILTERVFEALKSSYLRVDRKQRVADMSPDAIIRTVPWTP
jgi:histidyl-tRNA synthetase